MKKRNILILISNYFPIVGGAEKQAQLQAEELACRGHNVEILTALRGNSPKSEEINGVIITRIQYPKIKLVGALIFYLKIATHLLVNGKGFQIYHVHMVKNLAFIASVIGAIQGKKVLLKFTGWWELELGVLNPTRNKQVVNKCLLWGLNKASYYISISTDITKRILQAGFKKEKIAYVPNGVNMDLFCPSPHTPSPSTLTVLFIGRLVEEKGLFVLLEAWKEIIKKTDNCQLDIVGDGYLRQKLKNTVTEFNLIDSVHFCGKSSNTAQHYKRADIYVLPSFHEGLSNTLLEAMASGLPVVSTKISGTIDIVDHNISGLLVKPGAPDQLADSILTLLKSPNLRHDMGQQAIKTIREKFSIETVVSQLETLYSDGSHS